LSSESGGRLTLNYSLVIRGKVQNPTKVYTDSPSVEQCT
jgi:hypothetical protein